MENKTKEFILDQTTIKKLLTVYKLVIPDFQRSFVWKKSKRQQLLSSLFKGFPIGALTLYEDSGQYYIIDGLQRINTLQQYLSSPAKIVEFKDFYPKVQGQVEEFLKRNELSDKDVLIKKSIREWYEELDGLYEYEKMTILYNRIKKYPEIFEKLGDLDLVSELLDILEQNIRIIHDDIVLIIYKGDKEDLPELFKNINTGSVALSQYEILQSVWTNNYLDAEVLKEEYQAFTRELERIKDNYEISAVKENGKFDIFKNIIGLNNEICCIKDSNYLFNYSGYKSLPVEEETTYKCGIVKKYANDTIGFELYSSILCSSSNKIVKAVDMIYANDHMTEEISYFIKNLNEIIIQIINRLVDYLKKRELMLIESKYHSLYVITGLVMANYSINVEKLSISKISCIEAVENKCLDIERHKKEKWFLDENRQLGFFVKKLEELNQIKTSL